mmetsp:Transcript_46903/g.108790  ORF Transcript_46903/g.108790 Transcript_46903/m.108790 type:complete len:346 (+) Transcript_46903:184-1221(+)
MLSLGMIPGNSRFTGSPPLCGNAGGERAPSASGSHHEPPTARRIGSAMAPEMPATGAASLTATPTSPQSGPVPHSMSSHLGPLADLLGHRRRLAATVGDALHPAVQALAVAGAVPVGAALAGGALRALLRACLRALHREPRRRLLLCERGQVRQAPLRLVLHLLGEVLALHGLGRVVRELARGRDHLPVAHQGRAVVVDVRRGEIVHQRVVAAGRGQALGGGGDDVADPVSVLLGGLVDARLRDCPLLRGGTIAGRADREIFAGAIARERLLAERQGPRGGAAVPLAVALELQGELRAHAVLVDGARHHRAGGARRGGHLLRVRACEANSRHGGEGGNSTGDRHR